MKILISLKSQSSVYSEYMSCISYLFDSLEEGDGFETKKAIAEIEKTIPKKHLQDVFEEFIIAQLHDGVEYVATEYEAACKQLKLKLNIKTLEAIIKFFTPIVDDIGNVLKPAKYKDPILVQKLSKLAIHVK